MHCCFCRLADALEDNGGNEAAQDDYYDDAMDSQLLNSSRGKEVRPCTQSLSAAALVCGLLTLLLILKQTACFVHASALTLQGLTICSCMCRSAMTSWIHIRGAHTKAEGGL